MNAQFNLTMPAGYLRVGSGAEWKSGAAVIVLESNRFVRFAWKSNEQREHDFKTDLSGVAVRAGLRPQPAIVSWDSFLPPSKTLTVKGLL